MCFYSVMLDINCSSNNSGDTYGGLKSAKSFSQLLTCFHKGKKAPPAGIGISFFSLAC